MGSPFWENFEAARVISGKGRKEVILECRFSQSSLSVGYQRKSSPSAENAYKMAKSVNTTIEELVDGEDGARYLLETLGKTRGVIQIPQKFLPLVKNILLLDDSALSELNNFFDITFNKY